MSRASYLSLRLLRVLEHVERAHDVISSVAEDLSRERGPSLADLGAQARRIDDEVTQLLAAVLTASDAADAAARAEEQQIENAGNEPGAPTTSSELCSYKHEAGGVTSQECSAILPSQQPARDRAIQGAPAASVESRGNPAASPSASTGVGAGGNHEANQ